MSKYVEYDKNVFLCCCVAICLTSVVLLERCDAIHQKLKSLVALFNQRMYEIANKAWAKKADHVCTSHQSRSSCQLFSRGKKSELDISSFEQWCGLGEELLKMNKHDKPYKKDDAFRRN